MSGNGTETWLTQSAYDRLEQELEYISGPGRTDIAKKIEAARDEGDLKENAGYHAAREEQSKNEGRIIELTQLLRTAIVGTAADDGVVESGMLVTVKILGDEEVFLLGSREIAGEADVDICSEQSPLGIAISGLKPGDSTSYLAPNGRSIDVEIISATPFTG